MKILILLILIQICYKAIALHYSHDESAVIGEPRQMRFLLKEPSKNHHIIPSQPYTRKLVPDQTSSSQKRHRRHKKVIFPPNQRNNKPLFHHKPAPAIAANPHGQSIAIPPSDSPSISYYKHHHHQHYHYRHSFGHSQSQQGPTSMPPFSSPRAWSSPPALSPDISPFPSIIGNNTNATPPSPIMALPLPPPNTDCLSVTCTEPLTYTAAGSPCGCVQPIKIKLEVNVAIYSFFPLVSRLAEEIAAGVALSRGQVRIIGADAATQEQQQSDNTDVLVDLVPIGLRFGYVAAFRIYDSFWRRQVPINTSVFGHYKVLYVHYPGLPPSPPPAPFGISAEEDKPYGTHGGTIPMKPLGVDISQPNHTSLEKRTIAVIVVSSFAALVVFTAVFLALLIKLKSSSPQSSKSTTPIIIPHTTPKQKPKPEPEPKPKPTLLISSSRDVLESSLSSGTMTYAGSAKMFTSIEIERATKGFDSSRVVGEGGFGVVYRGTLEDGREVAVKVLKRRDQHGGREFLAEVEMLSRLHHRNLVRLIGICTDGLTRCLVYELVPNGSLESHLHGSDKEVEALDWDARMKIALGAARGLAYLHEDSNPRVIHRDFKASNILLEHDFTPKVSDFGLARSALEGHTHFSTQVMGTFGYLAPEYAMTGHLLVKSDVYSYGVVLLELLTGRKPVDLTQPAGQENLVAWVRPLLTDREALPSLIDPFLLNSGDLNIDTAGKVAAIASMCVQPEVNHRPFMGEVVQALNLVCADNFSDHIMASTSHDHNGNSISNSNSVGVVVNDENENRISSLLLLSRSEAVGDNNQGEREFSGSFRRMYSTSGQLLNRRFWHRLRSLSWGS